MILRGTRKGGLGSVISIVFVTLIILMALFLFVRIASVQLETLKSAKKLVEKAQLGASAADVCADVVNACSLGSLTFEKAKPYLVFHCAPPKEGKKILAVEVNMEVMFTTTGEKKEFVIFIPKNRIKAVNGITVKYVSSPGAPCSQSASVLEDVVGYVDYKSLASLIGVSPEDMLEGRVIIKVKDVYFLMKDTGWVKKGACGGGGAAAIATAPATPVAATAEAVPTVNIRPLRIFSEKYGESNYEYALTKPITEPLYVGECFEAQFYLPGAWLKLALSPSPELTVLKAFDFTKIRQSDFEAYWYPSSLEEAGSLWSGTFPRLTDQGLTLSVSSYQTPHAPGTLIVTRNTYEVPEGYGEVVWARVKVDGGALVLGFPAEASGENDLVRAIKNINGVYAVIYDNNTLWNEVVELFGNNSFVGIGVNGKVTPLAPLNDKGELEVGLTVQGGYAYLVINGKVVGNVSATQLNARDAALLAGIGGDVFVKQLKLCAVKAGVQPEEAVTRCKEAPEGRTAQLLVGKGELHVFSLETGEDLTEEGMVVLKRFGPSDVIKVKLTGETGVAVSYLMCYEKRVKTDTPVGVKVMLPTTVGGMTKYVVLTFATPLKLSTKAAPPAVSLVPAPGSPLEYCPPPKEVVGDNDAYVIAYLWKPKAVAFRNNVPTAVFIDLRSAIENAVKDPNHPLKKYIDLDYLRGIAVTVWEGVKNPGLYELQWTFTPLVPSSSSPGLPEESSGVLTFMASKPSGFAGSTTGAVCLYVGIAGIRPASGSGQLGDGKWVELMNVNGFKCLAPSANQKFKMCYVPYKGPNAPTVLVENEKGENVYRFLQPAVDSTKRAPRIVVTNDNTVDLKGYPVRLKLPDYLKGAPIRILDERAEPVPFCYETSAGQCVADPSKGDGYVWLKVDVPAEGKVTYYVFTDRNGAVDGAQVFPAYVDFENGTLNVACNYMPSFSDAAHATIRFLDPEGRLTLAYGRNMTVIFRFKWNNDGGEREDPEQIIVNKERAWEVAVNNGHFANVPTGELMIAIVHREGSSWCWQWVPVGYEVRPGEWYSIAIAYPFMDQRHARVYILHDGTVSVKTVDLASTSYGKGCWSSIYDFSLSISGRDNDDSLSGLESTFHGVVEKVTVFNVTLNDDEIVKLLRNTTSNSYYEAVANAPSKPVFLMGYDPANKVFYDIISGEEACTSECDDNVNYQGKLSVLCTLSVGKTTMYAVGTPTSGEQFDPFQAEGFFHIDNGKLVIEGRGYWNVFMPINSSSLARYDGVSIVVRTKGEGTDNYGFSPAIFSDGNKWVKWTLSSDTYVGYGWFEDSEGESSRLDSVGWSSEAWRTFEASISKDGTLKLTYGGRQRTFDLDGIDVEGVKFRLDEVKYVGFGSFATERIFPVKVEYIIAKPYVEGNVKATFVSDVASPLIGYVNFVTEKFNVTSFNELGRLRAVALTINSTETGVQPNVYGMKLSKVTALASGLVVPGQVEVGSDVIEVKAERDLPEGVPVLVTLPPELQVPFKLKYNGQDVSFCYVSGSSCSVVPSNAILFLLPKEMKAGERIFIVIEKGTNGAQKLFSDLLPSKDELSYERDPVNGGNYPTIKVKGKGEMLSIGSWPTGYGGSYDAYYPAPADVGHGTYAEVYADVEFLASGEVTLHVESDDGVRIWLDNSLVYDDWNSHSTRKKDKDIVVTKGLHRIRVQFFDHCWGGTLKLQFIGGLNLIKGDTITWHLHFFKDSRQPKNCGPIPPKRAPLPENFDGEGAEVKVERGFALEGPSLKSFVAGTAWAPLWTNATPAYVVKVYNPTGKVLKNVQIKVTGIDASKYLSVITEDGEEAKYCVEMPQTLECVGEPAESNTIWIKIPTLKPGYTKIFIGPVDRERSSIAPPQEVFDAYYSFKEALGCSLLNKNGVLYTHGSLIKPSNEGGSAKLKYDFKSNADEGTAVRLKFAVDSISGTYVLVEQPGYWGIAVDGGQLLVAATNDTARELRYVATGLTLTPNSWHELGALFTKEVELTVYNPNDKNLKGYQLKIKLPSTYKGEPITVYDQSGHALPFCYETSNYECSVNPEEGNGYIWVKVDLPARSNVTVRLVPGPNGAVSGDQVFDFYDDFKEGLDQTKWVLGSGRYGGIYYSVENGHLVTWSDYVWRTIRSKEPIQLEKAIVEARVYDSGDDRWHALYLTDAEGDANRYGILNHWEDSSMAVQTYCNGNKNHRYETLMDAFPTNQWIILRIVKDGNQYWGEAFDDNWNLLAKAKKKFACDGFTEPYIRQWKYGGNKDYWDWVRVRKYAEEEPRVVANSTSYVAVVRLDGKLRVVGLSFGNEHSATDYAIIGGNDPGIKVDYFKYSAAPSAAQCFSAGRCDVSVTFDVVNPGSSDKQFIEDGVVVELIGDAKVNVFENFACEGPAATIYYLNRAGGFWNVEEGKLVAKNVGMSIAVLRGELGDREVVEVYERSEEPSVAGLAQPAGFEIYNPNDKNLKGYQLKIKLPSTYKGEPITVYDQSGHALPFCYETSNYECSVNPEEGNGYIWVKVDLPAKGKKYVLIVKGHNGAVKGDEVFDFYDDFNYANGPFDGNEKWEVHRYSNDRSRECVINDGVLWLVTQSRRKACNVLAKNFRAKYNDKLIIEYRFKIDYVCGNRNDGDGLSLVIDGSDPTPSSGCDSGFNNQNQGIDINVNTDQSSTGSVSISNTPEACSLGNDDLAYIEASPKKSQLSDGIVKVVLTGTKIILNYKDLNPDGGEVNEAVSHPVWDPRGRGYLMFGAGTGCSSCSGGGCNDLDSAHGLDWVRVRKYAEEEPRVVPVGGGEWVVAYINGTTLTIRKGSELPGEVVAAASGQASSEWKVYSFVYDRMNKYIDVEGLRYADEDLANMNSIAIVAFNDTEIEWVRARKPEGDLIQVTLSRNTVPIISYGVVETEDVAQSNWLLISWQGENNVTMMTNSLGDYVFWYEGIKADKYVSGISAGGKGTVYEIYNPNDKNLKGYQLKIKLPSTYKGEPITVYDQSGHALPFCYETSNYECSVNPEEGNGYIWVKVDLPAKGKKYVLIVKGHNGAVGGDQVFDFYEDFEEYPVGKFTGSDKLVLSGNGDAQVMEEHGTKFLRMWTSNNKSLRLTTLSKINLLEYIFEIVLKAYGSSNDLDLVVMFPDLDGEYLHTYLGAQRRDYWEPPHSIFVANDGNFPNNVDVRGEQRIKESWAILAGWYDEEGHYHSYYSAEELVSTRTYDIDDKETRISIAINNDGQPKLDIGLIRVRKRAEREPEVKPVVEGVLYVLHRSQGVPTVNGLFSSTTEMAKYYTVGVFKPTWYIELQGPFYISK